MSLLSPAFDEIGLCKLGVGHLWSEFPLAHPLPNGRAAILQRSLEATSASLGNDGEAWRRVFAPFVDEDFLKSLLKPAWFGAEHLTKKVRFGLVAARSCASLARTRFSTEEARALFGGCAAHSTMGLDQAGTAAFGLVLALAAHTVGWPVIRGGSQQIIDALLRSFLKHGGVLETGRQITALGQIPRHKGVLFDLHPLQVARLCREALPSRYRERLLRFRRGPGVFKVDWALDGSIPWRNADCGRAVTVHVIGAYEELFRAEAQVSAGIAPSKPFVLLAQPSLVDPSRAPAGKHVGWAYCHVPNSSPEDMTERVEAQVERFAPGFRDRILARHTTSPLELEAYNPAMTGGDVGGGANDLLQFLFRPVLRWNPYTTPNPRIFLCSSSTPPGGGVHGMCGYLAARTVSKIFHLQSARPTEEQEGAV
jgi:phytoene dehydrogenase-like protein